MNGIEEQKEHIFKFKSKKGQEVELKYQPHLPVRITDEKEFQPYLEGIVDLIQCSDYKAKKIKREVKVEPKKATRKPKRKATPKPTPTDNAMGVDDV